MSKIVLIVDNYELKHNNKQVAADETVNFSIDGDQYTIDLTSDNADAFRADIEEWIDAADCISRSKKPVQKKPVKVQGAILEWWKGQTPEKKEVRDTIRAWGEANGWEPKSMTRQIPLDLVEAYEKENGRPEK